MKMIIIRVCKNLDNGKIVIITKRSFYKVLDKHEGTFICKAYRFKDENKLKEFINYCIDKYQKENVVVIK